MHFTITQILNLLSTYGYLILFPLIIIEGPFVTILSGFLASLGLFNFGFAYLTIMAGDLTGDVLYYSAGRWWFKGVTSKAISFFKITREHYDKLESVFNRHKGKFLFFGKLASFIGGIVMFVAGVVEVPFGEFVFINFAGTLFKSLTLMLVGYFLGSAISRLGKYLDLASSLGLFVLSLIFVGLYVLVTRLSKRYVNKLGGG